MGTLKLGKMTMRSLFKNRQLSCIQLFRESGRKEHGPYCYWVDKCIFCGICQKKCPTNALTVDRAGEHGQSKE